MIELNGHMLVEAVIFHSVIYLLYFFFYIFFPARIILGIFFSRQFLKYIYPFPTTVPYASIPEFVTTVRILKLLGINFKWYEIKKMPYYLDVLGFVMLASEVLFLVIGSVLAFYN